MDSNKRVEEYISGSYSLAHLAWGPSEQDTSVAAPTEVGGITPYFNSWPLVSRQPTLSTISSYNSRRDGGNRSRSSSFSTTASSFPSEPIAHLPCNFEILGCHEAFYRRDRWVEHQLSHFRGISLPSKSFCVFCDTVFDDPVDPVLNWRRKLAHEGHHHEHQFHPGPHRPDLFLFKHLFACGRLNKADFDHAMDFTERENICEGLLPLSTKSKIELLEEQRVLKSKKLKAKDEFEKEERRRRRGWR